MAVDNYKNSQCNLNASNSVFGFPRSFRVRQSGQHVDARHYTDRLSFLVHHNDPVDIGIDHHPRQCPD